MAKSRLSEAIAAANERSTIRAEHARLKGVLVTYGKRYAATTPGSQAEAYTATMVRSSGMLLTAFEHAHPELLEATDGPRRTADTL